MQKASGTSARRRSSTARMSRSRVAGDRLAEVHVRRRAGSGGVQ